MLKRLDLKSPGYFYVAAAAIIWGSNGVIVNLVPYDPHTVAFFRVLFASLTLLPVVLVTRKREAMTAARHWKTMLGLGSLLALGWSLLFSSMKLIPIANAVLLNYTAPIFVALLAPLVLKEKLEKSTLLALAMAVTGIAVISSQQSLQVGDPDSFNLLGVILGLLAGLAYAGYVLMSKRALSSFSSQAVAVWSYTAALAILTPSVIGVELSADLTSWVLLLVLGVFNTGFAVTLYLKGLGMVKAQKAVVLTYLEPVSAVFFGLLFLGQQPTLLMIVGGLLILIAGYIVASR
ncbi:MAG: EamA family transporter [Dehalococcoidia bacterium]|nr:EamA family transporter [Dehalococcoidia bacterium]